MKGTQKKNAPGDKRQKGSVFKIEKGVPRDHGSGRPASILIFEGKIPLNGGKRVPRRLGSIQDNPGILLGKNIA